MIALIPITSEYKGNRTVHFTVKINDIVVDISYYQTYNGTVQINSKKLDLLTSAGMQFDHSELEKQFAEALENAEELEIQRKRKLAEDRYDNSWVHTVNTNHQCAISTMTIMDREKFIANGYASMFITLSHKGMSTTITYRDVSTHRSSKDMRYSFQLSNEKKRNYKSFERAIDKAIEMMGEAVARKEASEKAKKERELETSSTFTYLQGIFGEADMILDSEWMRYSRRTVPVYYIKINKSVKLKISVGGTEEARTFTFSGVSGLVAQQVKDIIVILKQVNK